MIKNALIAVYILIVLAISAVARAGVFPNVATEGDEISASELQNYNFKTHVGNLTTSADGSLILVNEQQTLVLKSQTDLTAFIGSKVMISGIELDQQLAPSFGADSLDPLPGVSPGSNQVLFFVFGISEVR